LLRNLHFPKEINHLKAHLTLFHKLPPIPLINNALEEISAQQNAFKMHVAGVSSIGNGVAFKIESPDLKHIYTGLQIAFEALLIPQDKQKFWPHITVQNKVPAAQAKALKEELEIDFEPFQITAEGLVLWEYCNGPWQFYKAFNFS
jgi:2'-5' RNA ligase